MLSHMRYDCNRQSGNDLYDNCVMSKLSERLRTARIDKGMTQIDLAKKSGVSQSTISDIERGRNESSKELPDLARALGCSIDYLAGAKPQKPTDHQEMIPVIVWDAPKTWTRNITSSCPVST